MLNYVRSCIFCTGIETAIVQFLHTCVRGVGLGSHVFQKLSNILGLFNELLIHFEFLVSVGWRMQAKEFLAKHSFNPAMRI